MPTGVVLPPAYGGVKTLVLMVWPGVLSSWSLWLQSPFSMVGIQREISKFCNIFKDLAVYRVER